MQRIVDIDDKRCIRDRRARKMTRLQLHQLATIPQCVNVGPLRLWKVKSVDIRSVRALERLQKLILVIPGQDIGQTVFGSGVLLVLFVLFALSASGIALGPAIFGRAKGKYSSIRAFVGSFPSFQYKSWRGRVFVKPRAPAKRLQFPSIFFTSSWVYWILSLNGAFVST